MVFDIGAGLYWRLEEGGLLFGWSDPDEQPGEAREVDWAAYERYRERLAGARAGDAGPRAAQDLGGDDRLHARPPADPRSGDPTGRVGDRGRDRRIARRGTG